MPIILCTNQCPGLLKCLNHRQVSLTQDALSYETITHNSRRTSIHGEFTLIVDGT